MLNSKGKEVSTLTLDSEFVKSRVNKNVLYYAVNNYLASLHRGTHKTKKRGEVAGGNKKPWRQKGTGRARASSIRSPLWRGGGIIFGPQVRSYNYTIPKKVRRRAVFEALKSKIHSNDMVIFDKVLLDKPKTKLMLHILKSLKVGNRCLMVMEDVEDNIRLASRNISGFSAKNRKDINAMDILNHPKLAISEESLNNVMNKAAGK